MKMIDSEKIFCTCIEYTTTLGILREMNLSNLKVLKNSVLKKFLKTISIGF